MEKKNIPWIRGTCIGKGSFGTVSLAVCKSTGRVFAVKSVNSNSSLPSLVESLENEIGILRSLSSPYVVGYLGDDLTTESSTAVYRNLHMEYMSGGTVAELARRSRDADVDERLVRSYTWCVLSALSYIHSKGIVHCDVKGDNVLVSSIPGVAKLADFGSATAIQDSTREGKILPRGTPLWMAPEVVRQEWQGPESDVWSLGCTVIEMLTGKPAWQDCGASTICRIGFYNELPEFPAHLSELGRDFLDKCLRTEPSERWTCERLLRHPFVTPPCIVEESSPRCVLDWSISEFGDDGHEDDVQFIRNSPSSSAEHQAIAMNRIRGLASSRGAVWDSDGWEVVRSGVVGETEEAGTDGGELGEGTSWEHSNLNFTGEETAPAGTSSGYLNVERGMSTREESEGVELEIWNSFAGDELLGGVRRECNSWWRRGCKAGLGWQYGLGKWEVNVGKNEEACYGCSKLLFLMLLMIQRFHLLFLFITSALFS